MDIYSEKKAMKDLNSLYAEAVYGKPKTAGQELAKREKDDDAFGAPNKRPMVVTRADKKANTPAYQNYKKGDKRYTAADHLKNEEYGELYADVYNELQEKQKDTPDQVKAVIAFDKARKGTDDATYDSEHGKKKQAKKERDYAKWQRDKGAEDAQKSGHPWEHAKGSTREKEGKKSEKHAHIKDSFEPSENIIRLIESGKFSDAEIAKIADIQEADIADILARLEKKRISKGGNPDDSPLPAMKKYHADKKKKAKK